MKLQPLKSYFIKEGWRKDWRKTKEDLWNGATFATALMYVSLPFIAAVSIGGAIVYRHLKGESKPEEGYIDRSKLRIESQDKNSNGLYETIMEYQDKKYNIKYDPNQQEVYLTGFK